MSGAADVMAAVLLAFFLAGIAVGVVLVIAWSVRRASREGWEGRVDRGIRPAPEDEWPYRSPADPDGDEPHQPPWWQARDD